MRGVSFAPSKDYVTDTYLRQKWSDPRLSHADIKSPLDLADPNLVKAIWKPEVFFPNAKEANFQFVTVPNVLIRIHPGGEILYILRQVTQKSIDKWKEVEIYFKSKFGMSLQS